MQLNSGVPTSAGRRRWRMKDLIWFIIASGCLMFAMNALHAQLNVKEPRPQEAKTWAILIAGSKGWQNYGQQASVCRAYQLLKSGGIKDENIIVFMPDDIATDARNNPELGVIRPKKDGPNVYLGVPKDYTGANMTINNLKGVLYGDRTLIKGGSGKLLDSNSKDKIFIFFVSHGDANCVLMGDEDLHMDVLANMFREVHKRNKYESVVLYFSACQSGSMFSSNDAVYKEMNIYVMTSANDAEPSWGKVEEDPSIDNVPREGVFDSAWIEDSWLHDRRNRSLQQQFEKVKEIVASYVARVKFTLDYEEYYENIRYSSHVMQYGQTKLTNETLSLYHGFDPGSDAHQND